MKMKQCNNCKFMKDFNEFPKNGKVLRSYCKICHSTKQRERYKNNRATYLKSNKEYYEKNKNILLVKNKEYRLKNRNSILENKRIYYKTHKDIILLNAKMEKNKIKRNLKLKARRKVDKKFCIINSYRARLSQVLNKNKKNTYINFIKCSKTEFEKWILYQLCSKKTFNINNYGKKWVIDHVIPIKFFNLNDEQHKAICFSWCNLRILSVKANLIKSDKLNINIIRKHQRVLNNFQYVYNYSCFYNIYKWIILQLQSKNV